ncbi:MAG: sigma-70 family RNA polymerase sigma factor [Acidobacteria bacterium]|nr:sigma-70 family RNA polymerase sigma factor [Acidobacteriota bacterium]
MERCSFDRDYVESLRANDPSVQQHFAGYFRELLLIKLRRRVRSEEIANDLVQETFLRVLTTLRSDGLRSAPSLGAFVNSVCNNVLREHYRSDGRLVGFPEDSPGPPDRRAGPEDEVVTRQGQKQVRAVLRKLPSRDRDLLRKVFFEEEDKDDVCRELGVDREYLRVLLHRARNRFRELLKGG